MRDERLATLGDYLAVVRRRKWLILLALVVTTAAAVGFSLRQQKLYAASAHVLLNTSANVSLTNSGISSIDASRYDATQALLAHTPAVAALTIRAARTRDLTPAQLLRETTVSADPTSDVLTIQVTDPGAARAVLLANAFARQFTLYQTAFTTQTTRAALETVDKNLKAVSKQFEQAQKTGGAISLSVRLGQLTTQDQNLRSLLALQQGGAIVSDLATGSTETQPKLARNAVLGVVLGLVLGIGFAFLRESLDTRVRTTDDVAALLGLPLLGRLPTPPRKVRSSDQLVMLSADRHAHPEAYRKLRLNIDFANLTVRARSIMVTSSVEREGKSTTAANLAVALAMAGRRVILVDLDLRRPYVHKFFGLDERQGLTDVVLGHSALEQALATVVVTPAGTASNGNHAENGNGRPAEASGGVLQVLTAGPLPPNPAEFVESEVVSELLDALGSRADVVLIDSAPLLPVSDAVSLSRNVDAILFIARSSTIRRGMLVDARRALETVPANVLGFVLTGAESEQGYGYGYGYGEYRSSQSPPASSPPTEGLAARDG